MAGGAIGLAVLATLAQIRTNRLLEAGAEAIPAANGGFHLAFMVGAGLVASALLVAALMVRPGPATGPPAAPPEETAAATGPTEVSEGVRA